MIILTAPKATKEQIKHLKEEIAKFQQDPAHIIITNYDLYCQDILVEAQELKVAAPKRKK